MIVRGGNEQTERHHGPALALRRRIHCLIRKGKGVGFLFPISYLFPIPYRSYIPFSIFFSICFNLAYLLSNLHQYLLRLLLIHFQSFKLQLIGVGWMEKKTFFERHDTITPSHYLNFRHSRLQPVGLSAVRLACTWGCTWASGTVIVSCI